VILSPDNRTYRIVSEYKGDLQMKMSLQSAVAITHPGNDGETLFVCTPVDPRCSNGYDAMRSRGCRFWRQRNRNGLTP